jgi:prevent-host-death family protein
METLTTKEVRANFASCLDSAEKGEEVRITRQGHHDVALVSIEMLESLKSEANVIKELKAKLFDVITQKTPDEVNTLHDVLCILTDAPKITNPDIIQAIEAAESR